MGVGTILIETRRFDSIRAFCKDNDIHNHCVLPDSGTDKHGEIHRAVIYTDCSLEIRCHKCHLSTCPGCTDIQFVLNIDQGTSKDVCMGCLGMNIWEYIASKYDGVETPDGADGVMVAVSQDYATLSKYVENAQPCWLPRYGGRRNEPFTSLFKAPGKQLKCSMCQRVPSKDSRFLMALDAETCTCTDCLGKSLWQYLAGRHYDDISADVARGSPVADITSCWSRTIGKMVVV